MFFLFFGTRVRARALGRGSFRCPYCVQPRAYDLIASRTWFHVFWVPLFPLGAEVESARCTVCGNAWDPHVLRSAVLD